MHERLSSMLYVDGWMGWDGMGWMVIIGHKSCKSTFGANQSPTKNNAI